MLDNKSRGRLAKMFGFFGSKSHDTHSSKLVELQYRDIVPEDYDLLLTLDKENRKKTLTLIEVEKLPSVFLNHDHAEKYHSGDTCLVCMEAMSPGIVVRQLPGCGHIFHTDCIRKWLTEQAVSCPVDKMDVA